jgi:hypothetical protein
MAADQIVAQTANGVTAVQQPPQPNGMIVDPYTPVQNPLTPPPFNPFTADTTAVPPLAQPTIGTDGTQMQPDPTQVQQ